MPVPPVSTVVDINGLLGEWQDIQDSGGTIFHERWERIPDGSMAGVGTVLSGQDTVFIEHLGILNIKGKLHYAATVGSQNSGEAVLFELTHDRDSLVFTNPAHDFPQRIMYAPSGDDGWNVEVSGTNNGKTRTERYRFKRRTAGSAGSAP